MTSSERSAHLTMYGIVGVAMHVVVGVLIVASMAVVPVGWSITLALLWLAGAVIGGALWKRTVWIPLLASILVATAWMVVFFTSR
jgi:hypothetical protein